MARNLNAELQRVPLDFLWGLHTHAQTAEQHMVSLAVGVERTLRQIRDNHDCTGLERGTCDVCAPGPPRTRERGEFLRRWRRSMDQPAPAPNTCARGHPYGPEDYDERGYRKCKLCRTIARARRYRLQRAREQGGEFAYALAGPRSPRLG